MMTKITSCYRLADRDLTERLLQKGRSKAENALSLGVLNDSSNGRERQMSVRATFLARHRNDVYRSPTDVSDTGAPSPDSADKPAIRATWRALWKLTYVQHQIEIGRPQLQPQRSDLPDVFDQHLQGSRHLPSAGVVNLVTRPGGAPVRQNLPQLTTRDVGRQDRFGGIYQP